MDKIANRSGLRFVVLLLCAYAIFAWEIVRNVRAHDPLRVVTDVILVIVLTLLAYTSNRP